MSKERELLERAVEILGLLFEGPNDVDPNTLAMLGDTRLEEIRAYLADTNPSETISQPEIDRSEPVAWTSQEQLRYMEDSRYAECEMYMWKSPGNGMINIPLYLHPAPRGPFVRLSEEEISEIEASVPPKMGLNAAKKLFADRIQDALEEKNR